MFKKKYDYSGISKEKLKEELQILNYEILSTNDRRKIKQFRKRIEALKIELRRLKKEEINKQNIGRGRLNDKYKRR